MVLRLPSVAGRAGGIPEVVRDGESGFLVDPRDSAALAQKIIALLSDAALRENIALSARDFAVRELSIDATADANFKLYEEITGKQF